MKKYDSIVYLGRFQPLHNGHVETIKRALTLADTVFIGIGSSNAPRTYKNPFTYGERSVMIKDAFPNDDIIIFDVEDNMYDDIAWATDVRKNVNTRPGAKVGIIGHMKDESSYYLKMFPEWEVIDQGLVEPLDATQIRSLYFSDKYNPNFIRGVVPEATIVFLDEFKRYVGGYYDQIIRERKFIEDYKKQWSVAPYPPVFVTVDAVVVQAGHVLLVERKEEPGRGLFALPGGFLNAATDKSIEDAMLRELREETKIDVPDKVIRGSIENVHVFDAIGRSTRGRTITHAFSVIFHEHEFKLPKVKGSDDALKAFWLPLSKLDRSKMFDDHYDIIKYFH